MRLIKSFWPIVLLFGLELILFITNYKPGTYLIGWDNVMPEFNIGLNFTRALFSVWQDYRGLGILDGMAHAANLFHTLYVFLLSTFLPQNLIRYVFITLTHLAGGIGMYLLLKKTIRISKFIAFSGAMFYMFNIGVIQMFYAPLEVFSVHFAALPILSIWIKNTLDEPKIKNLFILFLSSLLLSPQGFVPTVFAAFIVLLFSFILIDFLINRNWKKIILIVFIIISANAFWILPYSYSALKTPSVIQNSRINQFSSEEVYLRNRARGDIIDVLSLKGFMLDSIEYDSVEGKNVLFMEQWRSHYNTVYSIGFSFVLILIFLLGVSFAISEKRKSFYPYLLGAFVSFVFLANNTPIFIYVSDLMRLFFPALGEAFRFPFTKFIILFAFCFTIFLVLGISVLQDLIRKINFRFAIPFYSLILLSLILMPYPAFKGHFFSPLLKKELPTAYKDIFRFFSSKDPSSRIALLPAYTFWNWQYTNWGHIGSGFAWYGIEQPLLLRAFDPWSLYNEQFYNEASYAINKDDIDLFERVLEKYDVEYLLLDKSILNSVSREPINYPALEGFLEGSGGKILKEKSFGNLIVYAVKNQRKSTLKPDDFTKVYPGFHFGYQDIIYNNFGQYIKDSKNPEVIFTLPSFYSGKLQEDLLFDADNLNDSIRFRSKVSFNYQAGEDLVLEISSLFDNEFIIPVEITANRNNIILSPILPKIIINDNVVISPQEEPIILTSNLQNPSSIEFTDTRDEIILTNGKGKGFIFNNYPNVLRLKKGKSQELIVVDTQNIERPVIKIPLPKVKIEKVEFVIDKIKSNLNIEGVIQNRLYQVKHKKDQLEIFPDDISTNTRELADGIVISASGNSSVDLSFSRENLPHEGSYLLFIESEYKTGLPINFYIDSEGPIPDFETKLSKKSNKNLVFLPKTESAFRGYGFHFIVKSVGRERAESELKDFNLYPFPAGTINSIIIQNNKTLKQTSEDAIFYLSQSYDPGWRAYSIQNAKFKMQNWLNMALPFVFGERIEEHVEVNGWANGWLLPANNQQPTTNSQIAIVYLPQYLEYAGFAILIMTFGMLIGKGSPKES